MDEYIDFGDVARNQMGQQCQYAARNLRDPVLSEGVRWKGRVEDYHGLTIHRDDVATFVARVQAWRVATGQISG